MNKYLKWIWNEWKGYKYNILILLFLTVLSTSVAVAYPYMFKYLLDSLQKILAQKTEYSVAMQKIYKIVWIIVAIGFVRLITASYPGFRAMMNLIFEYSLRNRFFSYIVKKDFSFFLNFRTGDLVTRLTNDIQDHPKIGWFMCSGIFRALDSFIKITFCMGMMFYLNVKLTFFAILPLPFMFLAFYLTSEKLYKNFQKNQEAISEINNQLEMTFSGIRIIKAFCSEDKYRRFFDQALKHRFKTEMKVVKINTMLSLIYEYIDHISMIGIILVGGYMVVKNQITIGTFYAFYTYLSMLIYPLLDLPQLLVSGKQAFVCIDRLEEIKDYPVNQYFSGKNIKIDTIESIDFHEVSFAFSDQTQPVLDKVSFHLNKGEKLLILGSAGAGKSTILSLLTGYYIPQQGVIRINRIPLQDIDLVSFRKLIGYVPQEPSLFSGSIQDNVEYGFSDFLAEEYKHVYKMVQIEDELDSFTHKDQTVIGHKGLSLSGGQKQRLAIARALLRKPHLLILDDITASLDAAKEDALWEDISEKFNDLTAFIVSHRLSSLRYADRVLLLKNGRVAAEGEHQEIMDSNDEYRDFIQYHKIKQ